MADPLEHAPKPQTRSQQWAATGIPKDPRKAHQRVRASRAVRRKPEPKAALSGMFRGSIVAAVEAISDRFDVSRSEVLERFITDGIRNYGTPEEIELARLREPSPFDRMPRQASQRKIDFNDGGRYYDDLARVLVTNEEIEKQVDFLTERYSPKQVPGLNAGAPLDYIQSLTAPVESKIVEATDESE